MNLVFFDVGNSIPTFEATTSFIGLRNDMYSLDACCVNCKLEELNVCFFLMDNVFRVSCMSGI